MVFVITFLNPWYKGEIDPELLTQILFIAKDIPRIQSNEPFSSVIHRPRPISPRTNWSNYSSLWIPNSVQNIKYFQKLKR